MSATSKINQLETPNQSFPLARKHKHHGYIVMFKSPRKGVVIHEVKSAPSFPMGMCSEQWVKCNDNNIWEPYYGSVTIIFPRQLIQNTRW